jgi:hypothetical protein
MWNRNRLKDPPILARPLTESEAIAFRKELREADQEVQSYFRVYYIVGLIGVAAWLVSPQSKPLVELMLGNGGYNIYVPLVIVFLNAVSLTYLLYKSIEIHEIAQFILYASKTDSPFVGWEQWRRSGMSATLLPRLLYTPFLTLVPLAVSGGLWYGSCKVLYTPVKDLVETAKSLRTATTQAPPEVGKSTSPATETLITSATSGPTPIPATTLSFSDEQMTNIGNVFWRAKRWLWGVAVVHLIPGFLVYFNVRRVPTRWRRIWPQHAKISQ